MNRRRVFVEHPLEPDRAQLDLWANNNKYENTIYRLPKKLDEEVARLHLEQIGVKLAVFTKEQATHRRTD